MSERKNDLHGKFDQMVDAVLAPPPAERNDRKPIRSRHEREAQRRQERRLNRSRSKPAKDGGIL